MGTTPEVATWDQFVPSVVEVERLKLSSAVNVPSAPVPVRLTGEPVIVTPVGLVALTISVPFAGPSAAGLNATPIVQEAPAASENVAVAGQLPTLTVPPPLVAPAAGAAFGTVNVVLLGTDAIVNVPLNAPF